MSLRYNPITYLILSNALLWGVPLAINHWQITLGSREAGATRIATKPAAAQDDGRLLEPLTAGTSDLLLKDPLLTPDPLLVPGLSGNNASAVATAMAGSATPQIARLGSMSSSQLPLQLEEVSGRLSSPNLLNQLRSADGLGGAITLASLNEPSIPIAARAEQLQWQRSNDALAALPLHWREPLRRELGDRVRVSQSATVRLPVRDLAERQEVPVIITDKGEAEGLVQPRNPRTRAAVESWAARQQPSETGTVQVVVVAAEPVDAPAKEESSVVASVIVHEQSSTPSGPPPLPPLPDPQI